MWKNRLLAKLPVQFAPNASHSTSAGQCLPPLRFLLPWLLSACVVLVSRFLHAADLGYDLTFQFEAAQNLLAGRGLTTYGQKVTGDLANPLTLQILTHFPSGFSLCAAVLMALGFGPGTALKSWEQLPRCSGGGVGRGSRSPTWKRAGGADGLWRGVAIAIAILTPLLFTPSWSGTDIIL